MLEARTQTNRPWPDPETPDLAVPTGLHRDRFRAMGTTVSLLLPVAQADRGAAAVRALFARWERALSRFIPDSELSYLNARAGEAVVVSPLLYRVIETALEAARATGGLFDPALLHHIVRLGYDRSFETLPYRVPRALLLPGPGGGWRAIQLDSQTRRVTLPRGIGLDLGGIAKGMAVDAALQHLQDQGITTALVNAGGDLAVIGLLPDGGPWPVAVPLREGTQIVTLYHGALATSGIGRRRWQQGNQERHHLLDPRSGRPMHSGLWSVSVSAATCTQAEAAAKAACLLGTDAGARFLREHRLSGLLVQEDGLYQMTGAWPAMAPIGGTQ